MVKRTGPTNTQMQQLIIALKKKGIDSNAGVWKKIATELERPTRERRVVNLSRINANAAENEVVVVPGKVLADGELTKKVSVVAYNFSQSAKEKIIASKGQIMTIEELLKKDLKASDLRILG